jgi:hypothetical protein
MQKPVCVSFPFFDGLSNDATLYKSLVKRSLEDFNENLLAKKCPKRFMCSTECLGRPIPAYPELEQFKGTLGPSEDGFYKGKPVWFVKATLCQSCPFVSSCQATCGTMEGFLSKDTYETGLDLDRVIAYNELEEYDDSRIYDTPDLSTGKAVVKTRSQIPWEVITPKQRRIVELRTLWLQDWEDIAKEVGDETKNCWRSFKRAIRKLRKHASGIVKNEVNKKHLTNEYVDSSMSIKNIAIKYNISVDDVYEEIAKSVLKVLNEMDN